MEDRFVWRIWDKIHERYIYCDFAGYCSVDYEGKGQKKIAFRPSGVEQVLTHTANSIIYADEEEAIVEQCTGLKDINGKLIYEGDILEDKNGYICYVMWNDCGWWVKSPGSEAEDNEYIDFYLNCSIIGNIHENPELLK